ncbi:hypothetical protein [Nocardioides plantarum]|uniref:Lipoprotein n=1 Tax=Nocardioides plantarum TaxID=29299 RepID=A0ABV5K649_9ACTN|nr:hypothetical protein [Nocardioides plantarum]
MITVSLVIGLVSVATLVACATAKPAGERGRQQSAARRRRFVEQHPTHVNSLDIRRELLRGGISPAQAQLVTEKAAERGIKPFTMWLWLEQHDAEALAVAVAADLSQCELLTHLSNGTAPDLAELEVFASVNGLVIDDQPAQATYRKVLVDSGAKVPHRKPMTRLLESGSLPVAPVAPASPIADRRPGFGNGGLAA